MENHHGKPDPHKPHQSKALRMVSLQVSECSAGSLLRYLYFAGIDQQCQNYAIKAQVEYEKSLILRSQEQPKLLHSSIRKKKVGCSFVGPLRLPSGKLSDDPAYMSEVFAESFVTVYSRSVPRNPYPHQQCHGTSLSTCTITQDNVLKVLLDVDGNSAMGLDEVLPLLLKNCAKQ